MFSVRQVFSGALDNFKLTKYGYTGRTQTEKGPQQGGGGLPASHVYQ